MPTPRPRRGLTISLFLALLAAACQSSITASPPASIAASPVSTPGASPAATSVQLPIGRIAFDRYEGGPEGAWLGLFVSDDAAGFRRVDLSLDTNDRTGPVWSPDGTHLLINPSPTDGPARPGIIDPTGSTYVAINVAGFDGAMTCTDWSPNGLQVICSVSSEDPARDGIYVVLADGTNPVRLTTSPFHATAGTAGECRGGDNRPVFSPDGTEFAFIRQQCGSGPDPSSGETGAIEIANIDGSRVRELVPPGGAFTHPGARLAWAPSGGLIAYTDQDLGLATVDTHGGGIRSIDLGSSAEFTGTLGPAWAPDAGWLAFPTVATDGLGSLFIARPDGTELTMLPGTAGAAGVDWGMTSRL